MPQPSLGQTVKNKDKHKLLSSISLYKYEPNQDDIDRLLGLDGYEEQRTNSWLNLTNGIRLPNYPA